MRLLRSFHLLAFALVFLSIVGLALAQQSVGLLLVAGALAAISWYITEGPRGRILPKWVSHVLILAVALHTTVDLVQVPHDMHVVLGRFGLWLTLIKLYERRTARDHAHLLMLSFLLMLVASLTATELIFGIVLLAYIALGIYVLLLYQLHASHERARDERQMTTPLEYRLLPPLKPIIGKHVTMNFRTLVVFIGIAGFTLGAIAFVVFPRDILQGAIRSMNFDSDRQRIGFADSINLTRSGRITDSRRPVMTVQLLNRRSEAFEHFGPLRLRGGVLNNYEGEGKWGFTSGSKPTPLGLAANVLRPVASFDVDPAYQYTQVVRLHQNTNVLFSQHAPVAISASRDTTVLYNARWQTLRLPSGSRSIAGYEVLVSPLPPSDLLAQLSDPDPVGRPDGLARLRHVRLEELARTVLEESGFDLKRPSRSEDEEGYWRWAREASHHLTRYFHSPLFRYTLDVGFAIPFVDGQRMDPVLFFLTEARRGHCEYFASAFVALCANLGIEARLVTGYLAGEYDESTQDYLVLERNAHAWVEVRTGDLHWTTFDPTPPAAISEITSTPPTFAERLLWSYDRAAAMWSRSILDFDSLTQRSMTERLDSEAWTEWGMHAVHRLRQWLMVINQAFYFGPAGYIYVAFVSVLVTVAIVVFFRRRRRAAAIRRAVHLDHLRGGVPASEYARVLRDSGFYLDMLDILDRAGVSKPMWMPPMKFADAIVRSHPSAAPLVRDLSQLFYHVRYGLNPLSSEQVREAKAMIAKLRTEVADKGD